MNDEPADERQRIGRVRLQAVRVHRQLAQLAQHVSPARAATDGLTARRSPPSIRALAQKLDALDHEVGSLHERSRLLLDELDAKMTAVTNRRLFTLVAPHRLPVAADPGHRLLWDEHQGLCRSRTATAAPGWRQRSRSAAAVACYWVLAQAARILGPSGTLAMDLAFHSREPRHFIMLSAPLALPPRDKPAP